MDPYIKRFFESPKNQSFPDWRAIVVDDCSTDDSLDLIHYSISNDPRFEVIANKTNLGLTRSLINAISTLDDNDIVIRLDVDELHASTYLSNVRYIFNIHSPDFFLFTPWNFFQPIFNSKYTYLKAFVLLLWGNIFVHSSSTFYVKIISFCWWILLQRRILSGLLIVDFCFYPNK